MGNGAGDTQVIMTLSEALDAERRKLRDVGLRAIAEEAANPVPRGPAILVSHDYYDRVARMPMPSRGARRRDMLKAMGQEDIGDMHVDDVIKMRLNRDTKPVVNTEEVLKEVLAERFSGKPIAKMVKERRKKYGDRPVSVPGEGFKRLEN